MLFRSNQHIRVLQKEEVALTPTTLRIPRTLSDLRRCSPDVKNPITHKVPRRRTARVEAKVLSVPTNFLSKLRGIDGQIRNLTRRGRYPWWRVWCGEVGGVVGD